MNRRQYHAISRKVAKLVAAAEDYAYSVGLSAKERDDLKKVRVKAAADLDNYLLNNLNPTESK